MLRLARTPRNRADSPESDARTLNSVAAYLDNNRRRGQRELVGSSITQLQIVRTRARCGRRKRDADNQVSRLKNILTVRRRVRLEIEVSNGNAALALHSLHLDRCFERRE